MLIYWRRIINGVVFLIDLSYDISWICLLFRICFAALFVFFLLSNSDTIWKLIIEFATNCFTCFFITCSPPTTFFHYVGINKRQVLEIIQVWSLQTSTNNYQSVGELWAIQWQLFQSGRKWFIHLQITVVVMASGSRIHTNKKSLHFLVM